MMMMIIITIIITGIIKSFAHKTLSLLSLPFPSFLFPN